MKFFLLLLTVLTGAAKSKACVGEQFNCTISGECIPPSFICDGYDDCGDNSDEQNCSIASTTSCPGFTCHNGRCIVEFWICDGDNDCGDWSDEIEETCPCSDGMRCPEIPGSTQPGICIPPEYICDADGVWDCPDGSDEANCTTTVNIHKVPRFRQETIRLAKERHKRKNIS